MLLEHRALLADTLSTKLQTLRAMHSKPKADTAGPSVMSQVTVTSELDKQLQKFQKKDQRREARRTAQGGGTDVDYLHQMGFAALCEVEDEEDWEAELRHHERMNPAPSMGGFGAGDTVIKALPSGECASYN